MNLKIEITAQAIGFLERVIRSCPPRMSNSGLEAKKILFDLSKEGRNMFFGDFLERLGVSDLSSSVFGHFFDVARKMGVDEIDERFVVEYFSGEFHFSEIARKIEEGDIVLMEKVDPLFFWRISIAHLILPGTLEDMSESGFVVRYRNEDTGFFIRNLIPYRKDCRNFEKGSLVWTHLVSVIGPADRAMADIALESQARNTGFVEACRRFENGLDVGLLSSYSAWAENACELFTN